MENDEELQARAARMALCRATSAQIRAENARLREERNARRNRAERDPVEYERQKDGQRATYAASKLIETGTTPRSYVKIEAATVAERDQKRKVRDAERKKNDYAGKSPEERQAESDVKANRQFIKRRRAAGMPEDQIQAELIVAIEKRAAKRAAKAQEEADEAEMRADPRHGIF